MASVEIRHDSGVAIVALAGEIDLQTSPSVRAAILETLALKQPMVIDLTAVRYIDSSGVASLVEGFQTARRQGGAFILAGVSASAMRVFQLARLDRVFALAETVPQALTQARRGAA